MKTVETYTLNNTEILTRFVRFQRFSLEHSDEVL